MNKDKEKDIITCYQQGLSVPILSIQHGISDKSIYYILKKNGISLRRRSDIGKILTQAQEEEIIALYQQGIDAVKLASRYKVGSTTIYGVLERNGMKRRTNSDIFRKLSPDQELEIIALYQQKVPTIEIADCYKINEQTVYNICERKGVERRSKSESAITYPRNEHAFDAIDNEEAAYWLGFIAADGNISNGRLRIGLASRDAGHLRKFRDWLAPTMPLYTSTNSLGRPVTTFDIGSQYLVEALSKYGILPRKTYVMKCLPGPFSPSLMRHLLRGFVDADGYFTTTRYGFGVGAFNKEVVEDIQNWFVSELGLSRTTLIHSGNWHYRKFGSVQVGKIAS